MNIKTLMRMSSYFLSTLPKLKGVLVISGAKIAVTTVKINLLRWFKSFEEV